MSDPSGHELFSSLISPERRQHCNAKYHLRDALESAIAGYWDGNNESFHRGYVMSALRTAAGIYGFDLIEKVSATETDSKVEEGCCRGLAQTGAGEGQQPSPVKSIPKTLILMEDDGSFEVCTDAPADVIVVYEAAPGDRLYRLSSTHEVSAERVATIIGDDVIGCSDDERHEALAHKITAHIDGKRHLTLVDTKEGTP